MKLKEGSEIKEFYSSGGGENELAPALKKLMYRLRHEFLVIEGAANGSIYSHTKIKIPAETGTNGIEETQEFQNYAFVESVIGGIEDFAAENIENIRFLSRIFLINEKIKTAFLRHKEHGEKTLDLNEKERSLLCSDLYTSFCMVFLEKARKFHQLSEDNLLKTDAFINVAARLSQLVDLAQMLLATPQEEKID